VAVQGGAPVQDPVKQNVLRALFGRLLDPEPDGCFILDQQERVPPAPRRKDETS
jgi:hypothetical protein